MKIDKPDGFELEMFKVDYIDFDKEHSPNYIYYELLPFKNKRKEFIYEQEFRIMLYQENPNPEIFKDFKIDFNTLKVSDIVKHGFISKINDIPSEGIKIKINVAELIDEIIASPYMEEYEVMEIQRILDIINKERNTHFIIKRSKIYDDLEY
jgi:hypothetical protein